MLISMSDSNAEIPYNIKVAAITGAMTEAYKIRLEIINQKGSEFQSRLEERKQGVKFFNFEKMLYLKLSELS